MPVFQPAHHCAGLSEGGTLEGWRGVLGAEGSPGPVAREKHQNAPRADLECLGLVVRELGRFLPSDVRGHLHPRADLRDPGHPVIGEPPQSAPRGGG